MGVQRGLGPSPAAAYLATLYSFTERGPLIWSLDYVHCVVIIYLSLVRHMIFFGSLSFWPKLYLLLNLHFGYASFCDVYILYHVPLSFISGVFLKHFT